MHNLTQISSKWIVTEENGERVARPVLASAIPGDMDSVIERLEYEETLPTFYTNHTPGSYKAEELGEVIWQYRRDDTKDWQTVGPLAYIRYNGFNDFQVFNKRYFTRLYIKAK